MGVGPAPVEATGVLDGEIVASVVAFAEGVGVTGKVDVGIAVKSVVGVETGDGVGFKTGVNVAEGPQAMPRASRRVRIKGPRAVNM